MRRFEATLLLAIALLAAVLFGCKPRVPPVPVGKIAPSPEEVTAVNAVAKAGGYEGHPHGFLAEPALEFQFGFTPEPTDQDLAMLRPILEAVPRGVGLNLNGASKITDAGVAHLKGMDNLKALSLGRTNVTPKCLETIKTLTNLEQLSIDNNNLTRNDLAQLANLTKLRDLGIVSDTLTEADMAHLANLTEIRRCFVSWPMGDVGMEHIKGWTKLQELDLGWTKLTDAGMVHLKSLNELRVVKLSGSGMHSNPGITDAGMAHLSNLPKLENFELFWCDDVTDNGFQSLKELKNLKKISIGHCGRVTNKTLGVLYELPVLEEVNFIGTAVTEPAISTFRRDRPEVEVHYQR